MPLRNSQNSFGIITKALHWLIALHMIGLIALGWWMIDLGFYSNWYYWAPFLHKAFGVVVFVLGLALLVWHWASPRPDPDAETGHSAREKLASKIAHWMLFASVIAIPLTGYLFTIAKGEGVDLFGLLILPALFPVSDFVRDLAIDVHIYASYGLLLVVAAHAGGALKHHFIDRDRTLRRMTF